MLVRFTSSFRNISLGTFSSMFNPGRISDLVCHVHESLFLVVLNSSNVGFVSNFCVFDIYVSLFSEEFSFLFLDIYKRK